jgi:hypothetical protein
MSAEKDVKKITIICPICSNHKPVPVPIDLIKGKETGATSVYIPTGMVCDHEFYAYIDRNFRVRDYLVLEYSLQDETKIMKTADSLDLEFKNISNFISETDFRSLIYSCFIESHIVLLEDDMYSERFGVLFNILAKIFPTQMETATIYTPEGFLKYKEKNKIPNGITVYNVTFKLSVIKPFSDSDSEPFEAMINILKEGPNKLQVIYAKNFMDYMRRFSEEIITHPMEQTLQISKLLKKKYPDHEDKFSQDLIRLMRKRNNFRLMHDKMGKIDSKPMIDLIKDHLSGKNYIYNEKIPVVHLLRKLYSSEIERHALKIIRTAKKMNIDQLIDGLLEREKELEMHFDFSKLPEVMHDFLDSNYIVAVVLK